ncbi:hypothetical protein [Streptomyces yaizuensis]|uniref:Uncharacterized protein n=1 Tax=Streptomyces yaizuensis TaxID=2989713 RepID=A0ABQ5NXW1_9ACTN|nr:hypothetical protein [Streptomyces sp. YSPA8]GLF95208.1 hypothetical protein SYYSPA8_12945 [Streptomyces sp. YSPA8]
MPVRDIPGRDVRAAERALVVAGLLLDGEGPLPIGGRTRSPASTANSPLSPR